MTSRVRIAPETTLLARKSTALGRKTERARGAWCGCTASAGAGERPGAGLAGGLPAGGGCTAPGNGSALSRQAVSDACARLRLGKSQLYELLRRYRIDPRTTSLVPGSGGIPKVAAWWCHRTVVRRWRRPWPAIVPPPRFWRPAGYRPGCCARCGATRSQCVAMWRRRGPWRLCALQRSVHPPSGVVSSGGWRGKRFRPRGRRLRRHEQATRACLVEQRFERRWRPLISAARRCEAEPGEFGPQLGERDAAASCH